MKRKTLIILVLIMTAASLPATAGEFKQWLKSQYEATHYQQDTFALEDPKGDAFLIRKLDQVPMKLLQALVKSSYPQAEIQKEKELKALEEGKKRGSWFQNWQNSSDRCRSSDQQVPGDNFALLPAHHSDTG